jgi:hypothetical protein
MFECEDDVAVAKFKVKFLRHPMPTNRSELGQLGFGPMLSSNQSYFWGPRGLVLFRFVSTKSILFRFCFVFLGADA